MYRQKALIGLCRARAGGALALWVLACASVVQGGNWPRFRGPNGQGISDAKGIPVKWSEQDYHWTLALPGTGHSSPVVWDDVLMVTCADEKAMRGYVLCVNPADGSERWRKAYDVGKYGLNRLNSFASPTPALDAEHVYVLWPGGDETTVAALTHEGGEVWSVKLPGVHSRHGQGSSPIVYDDCVIVSHEQDENTQGVASIWTALDYKSGQVRWRYEHPENGQASYSTPCVYGAGGQAQLIFTSNSHGIAGVHATTGEVLWKTASALPARVVSSPVVAGEMLIATCGKGGRGVRLAAVRPTVDADAQASELYGLTSRIVPYVPTAVAHDGLFVLFHDGGTVSCLRSATGDVLWSEKPAGRYYASPVWVDGRIYNTTLDGDVVVLEAGPAYNLLAVNPLGEKSHASAAVAGGRMFLRTLSRLVAIGAK